MIVNAAVISYNGHDLHLVPEEPIERELVQKNIQEVELRLNDGRTISNDQRKKVFAVIRDVSLWSGHDPEYLRQYFTWDFRGRTGLEPFSLSDVDMTTAREFLTYLIDFCFENNVPTKDTLLNQTDDIGKYLYLCLEHRKCAICNARAQVHHVDRVGMGRDREEIVHVGLRAIALCDKHHKAAHNGEQAFFERYHVYGIKLDEYLCNRLSLNTKERKGQHEHS